MPAHSKQTFFNQNDGFTLLEVMIALFVFTIGILATVSMQTTSIYGNKNANDTTEAAAIAASWAEHLRALDYEQDAELSDGDHGPFNIGLYTLTYNIERTAIVENTMLIRINVNWVDRGLPKFIDLDYIKSDII